MCLRAGSIRASPVVDRGLTVAVRDVVGVVDIAFAQRVGARQLQRCVALTG